MKVKRAGKRYKCFGCGEPINKGSQYYRSSKSFGSPGKETVDSVAGAPVVMMHGFRLDYTFHVNCEAYYG